MFTAVKRKKNATRHTIAIVAGPDRVAFQMIWIHGWPVGEFKTDSASPMTNIVASSIAKPMI